MNSVDIKKALHGYGLSFVDEVRVQPSTRSMGEIVAIEIRYHDITYEDLRKISDLFGTTKINIDNEVREEGYCETCRHSYNVTTLTIMEAKLNPGDDLEEARGQE